MDSSGSSSPSPYGDGVNLGLYEILGVDKTASQDDIKRAYRKLAVKVHPDKVPAEKRGESEAQFKLITKAKEILCDDQKRELYDRYGMDAFDPSKGGGGGGPGVDADMADILNHMFGGMGMAGGPGGARPRPKRRMDERSPDDEQAYTATLEELYKGKTVKFVAEKHVICGQCNGTGGKEKANSTQCEACDGIGMRQRLRQLGPILQNETVACDRCMGSGVVYKEKDRCRRCKGKCIVRETKALELYIPRGSMQGERIVLEGEADQFPNTKPGDLIFVLHEEPHHVFTRIGNDLSADLTVTLAEALTGFSRVVLKHLDGRGIHIDHPRGKILRPSQTLRVPGEGMPLKRGDAKGDLYLNVKIDFPENNWVSSDADYDTLQTLLPPPAPLMDVQESDDVEYEEEADIEEMGAQSGDPRANQWEDDDDDDEGSQARMQCAQQ